MTHKDIYDKFMIGYDKANQTSSYPSLTEYEIAVFLDKAYLMLIAQKVTGNNSRHVGFELDLKVTEDLGPLITTERITTINSNPLSYVHNALSCETPEDWLYFVSGELKRGEKTWAMRLIDHQSASKFYATAYNLPWIKNPVCYIEDGRVYTLYDSILQKNGDARISLTYIRQPNKFLVDDGANSRPPRPPHVEETWSVSDIIGPETVHNVLNGATYTATSTSTLGNSSNVLFSILSGSQYASITSGGVLTVKNYSAGQHSVTIKARSSDDPTVYKTKVITVEYYTDTNSTDPEEETWTGQWTLAADSIYNTLNTQTYSALFTSSLLNTAGAIYTMESGYEYATLINNNDNTCTIRVKNVDNFEHQIVIVAVCEEDLFSQIQRTVTVKYYAQDEPINTDWVLGDKFPAVLREEDEPVVEIWNTPTIIGSPSINNSSNTATYTASSTSSLGNTSSCTFSVQSGSQYAYITTMGVLTVSSLATEQQQVVIKATCTADTTKTSTKTITVQYYEEPQPEEEIWSIAREEVPTNIYNSSNIDQPDVLFSGSLGNEDYGEWQLISDSSQYVQVSTSGLIYVLSAATTNQTITVGVYRHGDTSRTIVKTYNIVVRYYTTEPQLASPNLSWHGLITNGVSNPITSYSGGVQPTLVNPNNVDVVYSTSNPSIATISETGVITPHSNGTCGIIATHEADSTYAAQTVTDSITVNIANMFMYTYPVGADSDTTLHPANYNYPNTRTDIIMSSGGTAMGVKIYGFDLGDINISSTNGSAGGFTYIPVIDDWGIIVTSDGAGWRGGVSNANDIYSTITISASNDTNNTYRKQYTFNATIDEDNALLLSGEYTSKIIRIPASGKSFSTYTMFYPYNYESRLFGCSLNLVGYYIIPPYTTLDYYTGYEMATLISNTNGEFISAASSTNTTGLTNKIDFTVEENKSQEYREAVVLLYPDYYNNPQLSNYADVVSIHILQEARKRNRIYYGPRKNTINNFGYIDVTNTSDSQNKDHVFQLASSKVLDGSFTLSQVHDYVVCYPVDFDFDVTTSALNATSTLYIWGDQEYIILELPVNNPYTITFTPKS